MKERVAEMPNEGTIIEEVAEVSNEEEAQGGSAEQEAVPANSSNDCIMMDQPVHYEDYYNNHL